MIAVGCDGTNVNEGINYGIIRMLENRLDKASESIICLLHCTDILRDYWQSIGKLRKQPITQFQPIPTNLPAISAQDISNKPEIFVQNN